MCEYIQEFHIYCEKTSKEVRDDFIKYYLDNIDQFYGNNQEATNCESSKPNINDARTFKILDFKSSLSNISSSVSIIRPQFSFLYQVYNLTVMIDLTQSMFWTTTDGNIKLEKGLEILKEILMRTLHKKYEYTPTVIINILCFKNSDVVVILRGWELQNDNIDAFYKLINHEIYNNINSDVGKSRANFFNVIREGILSLRLYENNYQSFSTLLVITDANFSIPDAPLTDKLISLFRFCSMSCSFIHIKNELEFSNFLNFTDQGNEDQLKFLANVTGGIYIASNELNSMNSKYILAYQSFNQSEYLNMDLSSSSPLSEKIVNITPVTLILSLINSGFYIQSFSILRDSRFDIELQLPWRSDAFFTVNLVTKLPSDQLKKCSFSLSVHGTPYLLRTLLMNPRYHSLSQVADVNIQRLNEFFQETQKCLFFMELFALLNNKSIYTIPGFILNGLKPMLSPSNQPCDKIPKPFLDFWKRMLDLNYKHCFHTTMINLLLEHDGPFLNYLITTDPVTNAYQIIQCRESLVQLDALISKSFCSFIIKESCTYVKFFHNQTTEKVESTAPSQACIIKLSTKNFNVQLLLLFYIYTPEIVRQEFVSSLRTAIENLKFPPRGKQARPRHMSSQMCKKQTHVPPQQRSWDQINCCILLNLDVENLIASYDAMRIFDEKSIVKGDVSTVTTNFFHHQCYHKNMIWNINDAFMKNIYESLVKIRLQEGFHIAKSEPFCGFINLIKEITLLNNSNNPYPCFIQYMIYFDHDKFHVDSDSRESLSEIYTINDRFSMTNPWKLIVKILIEKKFGVVTNCDPETEHWNGLTVDKIPQQIISIDQKCVETFVTIECFQIYPISLSKDIVKPNICSVLRNSIRFLLYFPLYSAETSENFLMINEVFLNILDRNLKLHGFKQIDITKTENMNFTKLVRDYEEFTEFKEAEIVWYCYYLLVTDNLIVLMVPSNYLSIEVDKEFMKNLPFYVYGMSLRHLSFLLEDRWTLKLPDKKIFKLPLNNNNPTNPDFQLDSRWECDIDNEFSMEIKQIHSFLVDCVKKLDSIYVLTFVAGVHRNLCDNRPIFHDELTMVFQEYCSELAYFDVDATRFMNTICSHCFSALQSNLLHNTQTLSLICKENCETKAGMHARIVKRIRTMMAKFFKEVPSFPQILIYCPETDLEDSAKSREKQKKDENSDQQSQEPKSVDEEVTCVDSNFEFDAKSISSFVAGKRSHCCPLFISINYTLKYGNKQQYLNFDSIPSCISDFISDITSITDGDIDFKKLRFHLDMIPITVIDEDLNDEVIQPKNESDSLIVEDETSFRLRHPQITEKYLTSVQTEVLKDCRNELVWTLNDEVVNCLKYQNPVDKTTVEFVMQHIENSIQKQYNLHLSQIRKHIFKLEFVFDFEKSKTLFQERLERFTFGKHDQYKLEKIGNMYCVFQKVKLSDDHSTFGMGLFPDPNIVDMDDVFTESRIKYESMCLGSLNKPAESVKEKSIKRWASDSRLNYKNYQRKMSSDPPERQSFLIYNPEKSNTPIVPDSAKPIECRPVSNIIALTNTYNIIRQSRSPMPYLISHHSGTPKRHRSGEASTTVYAGNYRPDTPMLLNDLISTATSSKGYEGDSSRVSDGEDMEMIEHFSNSVVDNKIDNIKSEMAPFWMLIDIDDKEKHLNICFHHTDNCWLSAPKYNFSVCEHCNSIELIIVKFYECVHQVNQCLLLEKLAQTRICRDILVPEDSKDQNSTVISQLMDYDLDDDSNDICKKIAPGTFACPKILKITFRLHYRLRVYDKNSKAIPLLRSGLENIAVLNRKNMLIFVDDNNKGIFYAVMREISGGLEQEDAERLNENSVLISRSNNQLSKTVRIEEIIQQNPSENIDNLSIKSAPSFSDSKPINKIIRNPSGQFKNVELLELSVYGLEKLSETIVSSIISNIGSKLDVIVLRKLSESICRSRAITLIKEDIDFFLSEDFNNKPQKPKSFSWRLPKLAVNNKLAFCYYLKQNLQLSFVSPKISDPALFERLYFNNENIGETYLYNQTSAQGIAHEVIALFTLQFLNEFTKSPYIIFENSLPDFQEPHDQSFEEQLNSNYVVEIDDNSNTVGKQKCYLNFNLWIRGLVDVEVIKKKIYYCVQHSLTDLFMEYVVIPCPISLTEEVMVADAKIDLRNDKTPEIDSKPPQLDNEQLSSMFSDHLDTWATELCKTDCPLLKYRTVEMFSDISVEYLVNDLVESLSDSTNLRTFHYADNTWTPWNWQNQKSGQDYPGKKHNFIAVGRLDELWKRFVNKRYAAQLENEDSPLGNSQTSLSLSSNTGVSSLTSSLSSQHANNISELRKVRILLRQPPLDNSLMNYSSNQSTSILSVNNSSAGIPEFCKIQISSPIIIPRQMLCIIRIVGCRLDIITYNLAKEKLDCLTSSVDNILKTHKSRFQMLTSFIYQKLGLFHECRSKSCLPIDNVNTVKTLLHNYSLTRVKSTNSSIPDLSRERHFSGTSRPSASTQMNNKSSNISHLKSSSSKSANNRPVSISMDLSRLYQDAYTVYQLSETRKSELHNDVVYHHAIQFFNTYQMEYKRRVLSKKIRQSINFLQPNSVFKQSELSDMDGPLQQLEVLSCLKRSCRIFHSVVCPILFIPSVRKRFLHSIQNKPAYKEDNLDEYSNNKDWIREIGRMILAFYADYVQKEHGFQFINPPRPNLSQNPGSHALFHKLSNNSGIHIIEVFLLKDCLCVRLNLLEIKRLNSSIPGFNSSMSSIHHIQNVQKSFVKDACKYCDLTHLVSFMYDIYIRMIARSISYPEENKLSLNPISFLRDLVVLYTQPPLYSTSHIYLMPFPVPNDMIKPDDLFTFLQRHHDDYNFSLYSLSGAKSDTDVNSEFLFNVFQERFSYGTLSSEKISPSSSSPLDRASGDMGIYYKYLDNADEWALTSVFCLTQSKENSDSSFDLFIITFNTSNIYPHQKLISVGNGNQKSSTYLASYMTILPHSSKDPANLLHLNPCPLTLTHIDANSMPKSLAWRTYENRSIVPLQAPLFFTLKSSIEKYFKETNEKFSKAITDCHKDSLWYRMYQRAESGNSRRMSMVFEDFENLIDSGDIVDILELDSRLVDSMKVAASYLKELHECLEILSSDCKTVLYENISSIYKLSQSVTSSHLVLMSKQTKDGFLLLSKCQEPDSYSNGHRVQLKAIFRAQDCRNRMSLQQKYFSSSLRNITVMLAETAAFCIWRSIAFKPVAPGK